MKVAVIGAGTLGRATGIGLLKRGNVVSFFDNNSRVTASLRGDGLSASDSTRGAIKDTELIFLCVPTPYLDGKFDLSFIEDAVEQIGECLDNQIVAIRSTLLPGTTSKISKQIPADALAYNPEFLREKFALEDFLSPQRIVIGTQSHGPRDILTRLYKNFNAPIISTDWKTAEMAKMISNAFLASKTSFFNEVWLLSKKLGVNAELIEDIASLDERIGPYGTRGGMPFEGACLPKDVRALHCFAESLGQNFLILSATLRVNDLLKDIVQRTPSGKLDQVPRVVQSDS
jgi:UDPglucose 6-dehydrogenase